MTVWSFRDVAFAAWSAGFNGDPLVIAVAITQPESGRNDQSRYVSPREDSRGLWQINTYAHPQFDGQQLYDRMYNARAAMTVYRNAGSRFTPWTTYVAGKHLPYIGAAQAGVAELRSIGYPIDTGSGAGGEAPAPLQPEVGGLPADMNWTVWHTHQSNAMNGASSDMYNAARALLGITHDAGGERPIPPQ
jgi:hypothetical protein